MESIKNTIIRTHPGISEGYAADLANTWRVVYTYSLLEPNASVEWAAGCAWDSIAYYLDDY